MVQVNQLPFGKIGNHDITTYQLISDNGFQVDVLNYGGIITAIHTPDLDGVLKNVVLHYNNIDDYLDDKAYLGAITGRHAGRIANANFVLDGVRYPLAANNGLHNLHGGVIGLSHRIWQVTTIKNGIRLTYQSPDLEEGFPGMVQFQVDYVIQNPYELTISYNAIPSCKTLINLTQHSYFNLSGNQCCDVLDHKLQINSTHYAINDNTGLVTGEIQSVDNTSFDFRKAKLIGRDIAIKDQQLINARGYDHAFKLNKSKSPSVAAVLAHPQSGRTLTISTGEDFIVVYSGNYLPMPHSGIALETQNIPNAINLQEFAGSLSLYDEAHPYLSKTIWQFGLQR